MAIGDNFDTTPPGFRNQTTGRYSGHDPLVVQHPGHYPDDNKGHPCNVGCGCKTACNEGTQLDQDARCQLPPELTIYITKAGDRDAAVRPAGVQGGVLGRGHDPELGVYPDALEHGGQDIPQLIEGGAVAPGRDF